MSEPIRRLFELLLCRLLPGRGCHRAAGPFPVAGREVATTVRPACVRERVPVRMLRGEDTPLVRPYVLTPAERRERRLRRERRRVLWLAVHGIDVGPRWIHGMKVAA
ncbi:hypothetical protein [Streptomyces sp. SID8354]|uniref:hypothetical protein n=2 Tax=unclassified Streptomyces TaxID=2593676 RepID=UPI001319D890|nr:hypothetical protein [Streptomyces sp. SID8354]MYT31988.1 hypothetical protein [Streptomyces sp. SID8354]